MKTRLRSNQRLSDVVLALTLTVVFLLCVKDVYAAARPAASADNALVISVRGAATCTDAAGSEHRLKSGMALPEGTTISTGRSGFVILRVADRQNVIRVRANSELTIETLSVREVGGESVINTKMKLKKGSLLGNVKKLAAASKFEVQTAKGVAGIRGTVFEVLAIGIVRCYRGQVTMLIVVAAVRNEITIEAGQQLNPGDQPTPNQPPRVIAIPLDARTAAQLEIRSLQRLIGERFEGDLRDLPDKIKGELNDPRNGDGGNISVTIRKQIIQRIQEFVKKRANTANLNNLVLIEQVVDSAVTSAINSSVSQAGATSAGAAAASYLDSIIIVNSGGSGGGTFTRPIFDATTARQNAILAARLAATVYDGLINRNSSPQQAFAGALAACEFFAETGDLEGARIYGQAIAADAPVNNLNRFFVEKFISPVE